MIFEWDNAKNEANVKKHGLRFETAVQIFKDPHQVMTEDRVVDGEMRWHTVGMLEGQHLLLVVHTYRDEQEEEVVRVISARVAEALERKRYGEGNLSA